MKNRWKYLVFGMLALVLGGAVYVFFRADTHLFRWISNLLQTECAIEQKDVFCNAFFRFYLSDMLWGVALGLGLMAIYDPIGKGAWLCAGAAVICGCVWEFAQWTKLVHGTGDILDVFMYLLGGFFSIIMNRNVRRKK